MKRYFAQLRTDVNHQYYCTMCDISWTIDLVVHTHEIQVQEQCFIARTIDRSEVVLKVHLC